MANKQIQKHPVKMERRDAIGLYGALQAIASIIKGGSFELVYAMKRNLDVLRVENDAVTEAREASKEFRVFDEERQGLCEEYAVTENGSAKLDAEGNYVIEPGREEEFRIKVGALRTRHKGAIDAQTARIRNFPTFLKEEVSFDLFCFPVALLAPFKEITAAQKMAMMPLFTDALEASGLEDHAGETAAKPEKAA